MDQKGTVSLSFKTRQRNAFEIFICISPKVIKSKNVIEEQKTLMYLSRITEVGYRE